VNWACGKRRGFSPGAAVRHSLLDAIRPDVPGCVARSALARSYCAPTGSDR